MNKEQSSHSERFQELHPIFCGRCGSVVPLADVESIACVYCGAPNEIPEGYRRGREARQQLEECRTRARDFLARLGRRPRRWEVGLTLVPSWAFFPVLGLFILLGFSVTLSILDSLLTRVLGVWVVDYFSPWALWPATSGILFLFLAMALAVYFLVRQRVFVTRRLMAVLAAGEPVKAGGPAVCRRCGAPFQVAPNELVAACSYCGTESFLQVPPEWVSATRNLCRSSGRNVFWGEREFDRETASSRQTFANLLILFGGFFAILTIGFLLEARSDEPGWHEQVGKAQREIFGRARDIPCPQVGIPFKMHGLFLRHRREIEFAYTIALKKGETLEISLLASESAQIQFFGPSQRASVNLVPGGVARYQAELGGWVKLFLTLPSEKPPLPTIRFDLTS
ncbi:MAG TPA: hypothetical protein PLM07_13495 [Candidatus Rifleibacterium sp.]|nr:hypothetical protein [Candidatus Rifleibacterium sp.]HPT46899.1 hypothetical protein [Candidatus Rifleibacterium sp.]